MEILNQLSEFFNRRIQISLIVINFPIHLLEVVLLIHCSDPSPPRDKREYARISHDIKPSFTRFRKYPVTKSLPK